MASQGQWVSCSEPFANGAHGPVLQAGLLSAAAVYWWEGRDTHLLKRRQTAIQERPAIALPLGGTYLQLAVCCLLTAAQRAQRGSQVPRLSPTRLQAPLPLFQLDFQADRLSLHGQQRIGVVSFARERLMRAGYELRRCGLLGHGLMAEGCRRTCRASRRACASAACSAALADASSRASAVRSLRARRSATPWASARRRCSSEGSSASRPRHSSRSALAACMHPKLSVHAYICARRQETRCKDLARHPGGSNQPRFAKGQVRKRGRLLTESPLRSVTLPPGVQGLNYPPPPPHPAPTRVQALA